MPNRTLSPNWPPSGGLAAWGPVAGLALALLAACGGGGNTASGTPTGPVVSCPIPTAPATPTWAADVYPLLHSPSCGSSTNTCHGGPGAQGRLDYSASSSVLYGALVNQPSTTFNTAGWAIVKPGDSAHSWIYEKVKPASGGQPGLAAGNPVGSQMPLGGALCAATTDTLQRWIDQGANP